MISQFVDTGSTYAAQIDNVILIIALITGFWFFLTMGVFYYFLYKFQAKNVDRAMYIEGTEKKYKRFITWPHFVIIAMDVVIIVVAVRAWVHVKQHLPKAEATVRIIGQQWAWTFVHPGPDRKLDTEDDITTIDELHVEVGKVYHYKLLAKDVLHSFSVPVFRLKQDAVPGRTITGWFEATITGSYDVQCAEMCGIGHGLMAARIHLRKAKGHLAWQKKWWRSRLNCNDGDPKKKANADVARWHKMFGPAEKCQVSPLALGK